MFSRIWFGRRARHARDVREPRRVVQLPWQGDAAIKPTGWWRAL
ncbi:hypothetical protein [Mycobacterium sp. M26]|nr:hypothetical protein [Mycobacterium sp. M26]